MHFNLYKGIISREILENTFLINFNNLKDKVNSIEKCNEEELLNNIHSICINSLKNYLLDNKNYFKDCDDYLRLDTLNAYFTQYAFDNIKLFLKTESNYNETISIEEAIDSFDKNNSRVARNYDNIRNRFKEFVDNDNLLHMYSIFYNITRNNKRKYNLYKDLSRVFVHTIDEWGNCSYNNKNILKSTTHKDNENFNFRYEIDKNFIIEFTMLLNLNIKDIYYFERIYNINFIINLYKSIIDLEKYNLYFNDIQINRLINAMIKIVYLQNVFSNVKLLFNLFAIYIDYYKNNNTKEFEEIITMLVNDVVEYFLPLYNSLFIEILNIYCDLNKIKIDNIIGKIRLDEYLDNSIYDILLENQDQINNIKKYEKFVGGKKREKEIYYLISENIICYFNFNRLKSENIISSLNIFNKNIFNSIDNVDEYQLNLKEFMLKVNRLKK